MSDITAPNWATTQPPADDEAARMLHRLVNLAGPIAAGSAAVLCLAQRAQQDDAGGGLSLDEVQTLQDLCLASNQLLAEVALDGADLLHRL